MTKKSVKGDISSSRIKSYLECPKKYRLSRASGIRSSNRHKRIGSLVHDCLDREGSHRKIHGTLSDPVTPSCLTRWLAECEGDEAYLISEIMKAREILEDISERIDYTGTSFCEEPWEVELAPGITAVGIFDIGEVSGNPDEPDYVLITDYKTGSNVMTTEDFMDDPQSALYVVAAKVRWPKAKRITVRFWWVELDAFLYVDWSPELDEAVRIHALDIERRIREGKDEPGKPNTWACLECPFKESCSEYKALANQNAMAVNSDKTPGEIMARREQASTLVKAEEEVVKTCNDLLKAKLGHKKEVVDGGFRARLTVKRTGHEEPGLAETVAVIKDVTSLGEANIADNISAVGKRELKSFLAGLPVEQREKIESELKSRRRPRSTSAYIDVRKIGAQIGGF